MKLQDAFPDSYTVFDLETTGLNPIKDDIIQIGILEVEYGCLFDDAYSYIVNPNFPKPYTVPDKITELTGITSAMVTMDGIGPAFIIPLIAERLRYTSIISHNGIRFDKPFLEVACRKYNTLAPRDDLWLDTAAIYKARQMDSMSLLDDCETFFEFGKNILDRRVRGLKYNLAHCCKDLGIDVSGVRMHQADSDCLATYRLFEALHGICVGDDD